MPVFGKIIYRKGLEKPEYEKDSTVLGTRAIEKDGTIHYVKRDREWSFDDAGKVEIVGAFPRLFPRHGDNVIVQKLKQKGEPPVILDWGCGNGNAANQFGSEYGNDVVSLGYSMDSYKDWAKLNDCSLIQSTSDGLLNELNDRGQSLDLVYSRVGLVYFFPGSGSGKSMQDGVEYISKLFTCMNDNGIIAFDVGKNNSGDIAKALAQRFQGKADVILDNQSIDGEDQIYVVKNPREEQNESISKRVQTGSGDIQERIEELTSDH